jgi:hypothetical protein
MNVRLECPGCGTNIIVMPPEIYKAIGDLKGIESELRRSGRLSWPA